MATPTITINLDGRCAECNKKGSGVAANGLCLPCTGKAINGRPMRSAQGKAVAARFKELKADPGRPVPPHGSGP